MSKVEQRRARVSETIVTTALEVMAEGGAASLSLGEVARRLGMRTPSLYGYFESRAALCDEIFRRGWEDYSRLMADVRPSADDDLAAVVHDRLTRAVTWANQNRATAELMFWRPIPLWAPSPTAFAAAVATIQDLRRAVAAAQAVGLLRESADVDEMTEALGVLFAGLISQQLSNEPGVDAHRGRISRHTRALADMYVHHYRPDHTRGGT